MDAVSDLHNNIPNMETNRMRPLLNVLRMEPLILCSCTGVLSGSFLKTQKRRKDMMRPSGIKR